MHKNIFPKGTTFTLSTLSCTAVYAHISCVCICPCLSCSQGNVDTVQDLSIVIKSLFPRKLLIICGSPGEQHKKLRINQKQSKLMQQRKYSIQLLTWTC